MGIDVSQVPEIPLLDIQPMDALPYQTDTCTTMYIATLFVIARDWKQTRCPSTEEQSIVELLKTMAS